MYGNDSRKDRIERSQMASMLPQAEEPVRTGQDVPAAVQELDRSVSRMGDAVDTLIGRLLLVLANDSTNTTAGPVVQTRGACQLSAAIWESGARIDALMRRVNDAIERLEV